MSEEQTIAEVIEEAVTEAAQEAVAEVLEEVAAEVAPVEEAPVGPDMSNEALFVALEALKERVAALEAK